MNRLDKDLETICAESCGNGDDPRLAEHDRAGMSRHRKVLSRLLAGESNQTIRFDELCALLRWLGFVDRRRGGSHRIFFRPGVPEILNLQPRNDGTCKPYQVRQVRDVILKHGLFISIDSEATDEP